MIDNQRYVLWRQDDNGQRFIVEAFDSRDSAEQRLQSLTRLQHKQIYWIEERDASGQ